MQITVCDRCQIPIPKSEDLKKARFTIYVTPISIVDVLKEVDLCPQCQNDLEKWLKGENAE